MKTANLTPWCSLFSTASKFSITIKKSCYRALLQVSAVVLFLLLMLVFFTYAYHLALSIAVGFAVLLGLLKANVNEPQAIVSTFEINAQGVCAFEDNSHYQVQANSRFSFLGCWLVLQALPSNTLLLSEANNRPKKLFFIYRDSLSKHDFSRISRIITQLNHQH